MSSIMGVPNFQNGGRFKKPDGKQSQAAVDFHRPPLDNIANSENKPPEKRKPKAVEPTENTDALKSKVNVTALSVAFSTHMIKDVDEADHGNPRFVSMYVNDIYDYMREIEKKNCVMANFIKSPQITGRMRSILLDWLAQVAIRFDLLSETFYLTVDIVDRYLQAKDVVKQKLQLVGVAAMFVAAKYEEMYIPPIRDFVYITDNAYTKLELRRMEVAILKALDFTLGRPSSLHFLKRNSKAGEVDGLAYTLAKYLMELAIIEYDMAHYAPSLLSAAALCLSMKILYNMPWTTTLVHYSKYEEKDLKPLMGKLARIALKAETQKLQAIRQKFASSKFMKISCNPKLRSPKMKEMALAV